MAREAWSALRHRDFAFLVTARFGAQLGSQMQTVAIGWFIYDVTSDPFALGFVGLAGFLPAVTLLIATGYVADRFDRRRILIMASLSLYLSLLCLALRGAADMVSVIIRQTLVQADTPNELRGRVAAFNSLFVSCSNEIGQFRAGVVAGFAGAVPSVVLGGLGAVAVAALWSRWFPSLRARDHLVLAEPKVEA